MFWLGANFHHNIDFRTGPFAASGFVMYNGGEYSSSDPDTTINPSVKISGLSANRSCTTTGAARSTTW